MALNLTSRLQVTAHYFGTAATPPHGTNHGGGWSMTPNSGAALP